MLRDSKIESEGVERSDCTTGCFSTVPTKDSVRFKVSQIVEKTKTCNSSTTKLTGNFSGRKIEQSTE